MHLGSTPLIVSTAIALAVVTGCSSQPQQVEANSQSVQAEQLLYEGSELLQMRNTAKAIKKLDQALSDCSDLIDAKDQKIYASRNEKDTLYYMLLAAKNGEPAIAISTTCSDALFLRAYASVDLGQIELAENYIEKAVSMAPVHSAYLSELGHIYQAQRRWQAALDTFKLAEQAAKNYSPDEVKDKELARAKRGIGYSLIELGELEEAEVVFNECLTLNPQDQTAQHELAYIRELRQQRDVGF